ncbi:uncharacterized protein SPPG_01500 [Spizellomyces punctatus DAOM BR117]|uniref:Transmembrane protein 135 N-terminal domain-containing protein n=1 Tax=Spizellomyces punctatus (strain DAOM BR117) TaxID=645134 RepID=A0A0L0HRQ8_SPIPD|nr:uncharacterized protein SPPG_01500 [Spizellomyces punctatus DAOM BR117]KND04056.1 hypothetical protein SPPG_01500 [Spizellomyces punctatus DAOM BR117]|eukprot:XP_016612095.1 hypothetical protein SPPG_01500 [Spizellomyces punctatus DAOM BR117]
MSSAPVSRKLVHDAAELTESRPLFVPPFKASFHRIFLSALKAYFSGYAVACIPRIVSLILKRLVSRGKNSSKAPAHSLLGQLFQILSKSFKARLPWFFLVLIGGFRLFDRLFWEIARKVGWRPLDGKTAVAWDGKKNGNGMVVGSVVEGVSMAAEADDHPYEASPNLESKRQIDTKNAPQLPPARNILSPTFLAGVASSALALLTIEPARRADFALFTLVRAMDSFASFQNHKIQRMLRWVPPILMNNMDTSVFVACCTQIMYCWFYYPEALPRSYVKWIQKMSRMDPRLLEAVKLLGKGVMVYGKDTGHAHLVGDYAEEMGYGFAAGDPVNGFISCTLIHCGIEGCWTHLVDVWRSGFFDALKIYIPVHLLPALIFHRRRFFSNQFPSTVLHVATNALRSSTFLATFIAGVWAPICVVRNVSRQDTTLGPLLGSFLCGFSLLLERKSRRREIGLYCLPKALESSWWRITHALGMGGIKIPGGDVALFAMGMGYLLSAYQYHHKALRPAVRGLLGFFLV